MPSSTIRSSSTVADWQEDRTDTSTPRISLAKTVTNLSEAKGTTRSQILMIYTPDGDATFTFTEAVEGKNFDGVEGSFMTIGRGFYDSKGYQTKAEFEVVAGTGSGGLQGVKGKGTFASRKDDHKMVDYEFDISW